MLTISPRDKAIERYHRELDEYRKQGVDYESATRTAFQNLLAKFAPSAGWIVIPEQPLANGKRPDATLRDDFTLPRGYWEAKDTADDLDAEIRRKIASGYPTINTIFEDTKWAVLYQSGRTVDRFDLHQPRAIADLLTQFFNHTEPHIESFEKAVEDFKDRIPDLAQGLLDLIRKEHIDNKRFRDAFTGFYALCSTSLNPKISTPELYDMLVQHLLTERLFRTVFRNPDFTRRNVIAAEIETVIGALTSRAFNRDDFLRKLDRFYTAIEGAAQGLEEWSERQAFLDTVYERFFQGFSVRDADTHGIKYTPQEIVDFMCASVEEVLEHEFGTSLSSPGVQVLDPCTGTGNFVVNLIRRISGMNLPYKYAKDLFANEVMLLPYYIASLNIEHAFFDRMGRYEPFEGICFVDTLDLAERIDSKGNLQKPLMVTERNTERVEREREAPIMVVIGNPPYNVGQGNENDNNKNRDYPEIDRRVRGTYAKDSTASNKNALDDVMVKFFRWASDRLQGRDGIVCLVSNNGFLNGIAFDGFRKHLLQDFTRVYHFDLKGNARTSGERRRQEGGNVFDDSIRAGIGITILIRSRHHTERGVWYHSTGDYWTGGRKREYLRECQSWSHVAWQPMHIDGHHNWLVEELPREFAGFLPIGTKEAKALTASAAEVPTIFKNYGRGVATTRDAWVYDFGKAALAEKVERMIEAYNGEVDRWKRRGGSSVAVDDFVAYDDTRIKWSRDLKLDLQRGHYAEFAESKVRHALYRPFCRQWLFFDRILNEEVYQFPQFFPTPSSERENAVIVVSDHGHRAPFGVLATNVIADLHLVAPIDAFQCFPLYTYIEDGSSRRDNITDWALSQFQATHGERVSKRDIFNYVYAMLHHPEYRHHYAENLKRELPRIPLLPNRADFDSCVRIGAELMRLHLNYETMQEYQLEWREMSGVRPDWRVEKMKLSPDRTAVIYNRWLTLAGVPAECFEYRLGNQSRWIGSLRSTGSARTSAAASRVTRIAPTSPSTSLGWLGTWCRSVSRQYAWCVSWSRQSPWRAWLRRP